MNFIQRAIKNVLRRKSKSILLILTFFLIGNLVIIGLGVSTASESAKTLTRQKMRAVVTYGLDYNEIDKYIQGLEDETEIDNFYDKGYPKVTIEDVNEILKDERVKTANAISNNMVYEVDGDMSYVRLNNKVEEEDSDGQSCYIDEDGNEECVKYVNPSFMIKANYFPDMIEFTDGEYQITDGRFYNQEDIDNKNKVVLITEELAESNSLKVGDNIKIYYASPNELKYYEDMGITEEDILLDYEIIGIYSHTQQITPDNNNFDWTYPYENPSNVLLLPGTSFNDSLEKFYDKLSKYYEETYGDSYNYKEIYLGNVTLLLNDPLEVDNFVKEYSSNLKQFMKLDANNEEFEKLSKPLDTLSLYANFIVWLVVINAIVIITLVTALTLKTREYEIGVLLSIGATKLKVVGQFFIELALVAVIGFTLSIGSGSIVSNQVGQKVLEYQISTSDLNNDDDNDYGFGDYIDIWNTDYSSDITLEDLVSEYNVTISPLIIAEIYVLGLGIVLVSVIIPSIMIMRFNPKKILMNQG